jgi:type IV pilus assembly protein PilA
MSPFRRLFNDHWGVTLVFGIFWFIAVAVALIGPEDPRHQNPGPLLLFLAALTVLVSFAWSNSRHYQQVEGTFKRRSFTWGSAFADLVVFVILFSLPAAILAPAYGNYTIRARMSEMVATAGALKTPIAEAAMDGKTLKGAGAPVKPGAIKNADYALVSADGVIIAYNERHGALLVLTPSMTEKEVSWQCQGYPARFFPSACRGERSK